MVINCKAKAQQLRFLAYLAAFLAHVEETPELRFCLSFQNQGSYSFVFS